MKSLERKISSNARSLTPKSKESYKTGELLVSLSILRPIPFFSFFVAVCSEVGAGPSLICWSRLIEDRFSFFLAEALARRCNHILHCCSALCLSGGLSPGCESMPVLSAMRRGWRTGWRAACGGCGKDGGGSGRPPPRPPSCLRWPPIVAPSRLVVPRRDPTRPSHLGSPRLLPAGRRSLRWAGPEWDQCVAGHRSATGLPRAACLPGCQTWLLPVNVVGGRCGHTRPIRWFGHR